MQIITMQSHLNIYATGDLWVPREQTRHGDASIQRAIQGSNCTNCDQLPAAAARQSLCSRFIIHQRAHTESTQTIKFHNNVSNPHLDQFCNADALHMIQLKQTAAFMSLLRIVDQQHGAFYYAHTLFSHFWREPTSLAARTVTRPDLMHRRPVKVPCFRYANSAVHCKIFISRVYTDK